MFEIVVSVEFDVLHDYVHVDVEDELQPEKIRREKKNAKVFQLTSLAIASSAESSANEELSSSEIFTGDVTAEDCRYRLIRSYSYHQRKSNHYERKLAFFCSFV